jgi:hypothetical protein
MRRPARPSKWNQSDVLRHRVEIDSVSNTSAEVHDRVACINPRYDPL